MAVSSKKSPREPSNFPFVTVFPGNVANYTLLEAWLRKTPSSAPRKARISDRSYAFFFIGTVLEANTLIPTIDCVRPNVQMETTDDTVALKVKLLADVGRNVARVVIV